MTNGTNSDCESVTVTVTNVAPTVTLTGRHRQAGQTLTFSYVITDPGDDTHTVVKDFGDAGVYVTPRPPRASTAPSRVGPPPRR